MPRTLVLRCIASFVVIVCLFAPASMPLLAEENYPVPPEAKPREGVPRGTVERFSFSDSKLFPGTTRQVAVYIPANLNDSAAALMVFQDGPKYVREGGQWNLPTVFDNLIAEGAMPATVAVCVSPGVTPAASATLLSQNGSLVSAKSNDGKGSGRERFNRSFEYDSVSSRYGDFLCDELLPAVSRRVKLSDDPNLAAIGGSSSGAIAAFGAAWHRPDRFRRVFSTIGTYVGLRGGNNYPTLIRHSEPKPLRVYLQDGSNDLDIYGGDWFNANTGMLSALRWGGYEVKHQWGEGGHSGHHGAAIFPDALRYLWSDWDKPIATPKVNDHPEWSHWIVDGEDWKSAEKWPTFETRQQRFGHLDLVFNHTNAGTTVIAKPAERGVRDSDVRGDAMVVTPDNRFLLVAHDDRRHTVSYRIADDGTLQSGQPFGYLFVPPSELRTGVSAATMTNEGEAMFATTLGIQCFDQPGRVHLILDPPLASKRIRRLALVEDQLFAEADGRLFVRKMKVRGVGDRPSIPPKPRL